MCVCLQVLILEINFRCNSFAVSLFVTLEIAQVQKIEVDYDKTSKQIDVRVLKETLWQNLQETSSHQVFLIWGKHRNIFPRVFLCPLTFSYFLIQPRKSNSMLFPRVISYDGQAILLFSQ